MAIPFVGSSVVLFAVRGAVRLHHASPRLKFLLGFAGSEFTPILTGDRFVAFVILVAVAFGLAFEFPVLLVFLEMVGVLSTERGSRNGAGSRSWDRGLRGDNSAVVGSVHDAGHDDPDVAVL